MFTARKKIAKEAGAEPTELEEQVAQVRSSAPSPRGGACCCPGRAAAAASEQQAGPQGVLRQQGSSSRMEHSWKCCRIGMLGEWREAACAAAAAANVAVGEVPEGSTGRRAARGSGH